MFCAIVILYRLAGCNAQPRVPVFIQRVPTATEYISLLQQCE
jgi:hypothetical protein